VTHEQMWIRFRKIKKDKPYLEITCPVCNKEIKEGDNEIEYSKSRSGSEIFIHLDCVILHGVHTAVSVYKI